MWERCRPPMAIVIIGIKGDKEGQTTGWNKSGLNNGNKSICWLSNTLSLIYNLLAPLFRRIRATFSRFNFFDLCFSPQSGKTSCYVSNTKWWPLSALRATLPEGESFLSRHLRATFSQFNFLCLCFSPQSGKTFSFSHSVIVNYATESVPPRRSISKFWAKLGGMPSPREVVINWNSIRQRGASVKLK